MMVDTIGAAADDFGRLTLREKRARAKRVVNHAKTALRLAQEHKDEALIQACQRQLAQAREARNCLLPRPDLR